MNRKRLEEINHELKQENDFLVMDGITDYEQFGKSGKKILWIMKETNQSGGTHPDDLRDFHKNVKTYLKWRRTYRPIIKSTYGIIHNLDYEAIPKEEDISWILNEIAFINIKKTGGGSTSNWKSIAEHYAKNKEVILEQVECIDPDIIINCSGIFQVFTDLTQANYANPGRFYVAKSNKWIVVNAYHPNQRSINQVQYYNLIKDCIKSVQNV
jgi:hypothetical protein